jgi:putative oxidoreductase
MRIPASATAAIGRVALSLIFVLSALGKLAAPEATLGYIASAGLPSPLVALWGAITIELFGGAALAFGLGTRMVAVVLAGFSLLTAIFFHAEFADQNQMVHFLKNIAIAGGMLQLAAFGAGSISIDGFLAVRSAAGAEN